jgi:hypothetical protein
MEDSMKIKLALLAVLLATAFTAQAKSTIIIYPWKITCPHECMLVRDHFGVVWVADTVKGSVVTFTLMDGNEGTTTQPWIRNK